MNARSCPIRALASAIFILALTALSAAHAQPAAPPPVRRVDKAPPAPPEGAPIEVFDLGKALMAESGGLTSDVAASRAQERAPQIASARAAAAASDEDAEIAWAAFLPRVDFLAQYKRVKYVDNSAAFNFSDTLGPLFDAAAAAGIPIDTESFEALQGSRGLFNQPRDNYSLSGTVQYPISDVFLRAWPAYKASVGMAEAQATQTEVTQAAVDLSARNAFYEYARALAQQAVDGQALKQAEAQSAQIKLFVDAGTVAPVDLMTATARVQEARAAVANSETRAAITRNNLAVLMGVASSDIAGLGEPVLDPPSAPKNSPEDLVRKASDQRPELRALRKLVAANDYAHTAQRNSALPQIVLSANGLTAQPNPRYVPPNIGSGRGPIRDRTNFKESWEVGVGLAWTPNNTLTGVHAGRKAEAQLHKARADLAAQEDTVRMEVVTAYQNYISARSVTEAAESRLKASEEAYRVRLAMYRVGAGVIVDLLQADLTLTLARLQRAAAAINARAALAALRRAAAVEP
jgi:outer membrane protein TolC